MFSKFKNDSRITWLDVNILHTMAAPNPTYLSDAQYDALWESLKLNGMQEPLMVTETDELLRLDSGNHRIQLFKKYHITPIPCIIQKVKDIVKSPGNGLHIGAFKEDISLMTKW